MLKQHLSLLTFLLLITTPLFAQNNILKGKILYFSSGNKPAKGVEVQGTVKNTQWSNAVRSTDDGAFEIEFPKEAVGQKVQLIIGTKDRYSQPIEVVNQKVVDEFRLAKNAGDIFEIIVCKKGQRDLAAQRYYKILKTGADRELAKTKQRLDQLMAEKEKQYDDIRALFTHIDKLEERARDSTALYKAAFKIASINRDKATERVKKYLDLLDKGESIEEALKVLNIKIAIQEARNGIQDFDNAIQEIETKAEAFAGLFQYGKAIALYDSIIVLHVEADKNLLIIAKYRVSIANQLKINGQYLLALQQEVQVVKLREKLLNKNDKDLAKIYNNIATTYQRLGEYNKALKFHLKAIKIKEAVLEPNHPDLAISYGNIAITYQYLGEYNKALEFHFKAIKILEAVLEPNHPDLATSFNNIANTYDSLGEYNKALEFHFKAIKIRQAVLEPNHPDLANSFNNIAGTYQYLGEYNKALEFHFKAIKILEAVLEPNHPDLAAFFNNMAITYERLGKYNKALEIHFKAIKIRQAVFELDHPDLATSFNNIATTYKKLGEYNKAIKFQIKAIEIFIKVLPENHPSLVIILNNFMDIYNKKATSQLSKKQYKSALKDFQTIHQLQPSGENWNSIGLCHYYLKKYPKAIEAYQQSIELDSTLLQKDYYNNIGMAYAKNKQFKKAKTAFKSYQKIYPKQGRTYRNWAMYHALQGETDKALTFLQQAIDLGYKDLDFLENDDSMESLREDKRFKALLKAVRE